MSVCQGPRGLQTCVGCWEWAGIGVSLVPTPRGDKSALLFRGLVWANSRTLRVSRQRCKFGEDIEYLQCPASSSCEIAALSIASLPAQVGKLRHKSFSFTSQNQRINGKDRLGCWFPNPHSYPLLCCLSIETSVPLYFMPILFVTFDFTSLK